MLFGGLGGIGGVVLLLLLMGPRGNGLSLATAETKWPQLGEEVLRGFWSDTGAQLPSLEYIQAVRVSRAVTDTGVEI